MKLGLFSDVHYCRENASYGNRKCALSFNKITSALQDFKAQKADYIISMGDLCDVNREHNTAESEECLLQIMREVDKTGIPFMQITGNHDCLVAPLDRLTALTGVKLPPYTMETPEFTLICLDANDSSDGTHFGPEGFDWIDVNLPQEQLAFLKTALDASKKDCIVLIHEPVDSSTEEIFRVNNAAEVRKILEASGKVKLVLQGHMHQYYDVIENGIRYITVVGMCEGEENRYMILDITKDRLEIQHITDKPCMNA